MPRGEFQRSYFQEKLIPEFDDRLVIDFINPTPEDPEFRLKAAQARPETVRINEWRDLQGLDDLEDGSGELFLVKSAGEKAVESFEEMQVDEADMILPTDPFGNPVPPNPQEDPEEEEEQEGQQEPEDQDEE